MNPCRQRAPKSRTTARRTWRLGLALVALQIAWLAPSPLGAQQPESPANPPTSGKTPSSSTSAARQVQISLAEAIRIAVRLNLDLQVERLARANSQRDVVIALSSFDPLFSTSFNIAKYRSPAIGFLSGLPSASQVTVNPFNTQTYSIGINGLLPSGTTYSLQAEDDRSDRPKSDPAFTPINPLHATAITATVTQPLLQGFGFANNLADVRIARENSRISNLRLRRLLETTVFNVQNSYWTLVFSRKNLEVKRQALGEARELLDINRNKLAVGKATQLDVIDAEANIETQRSGIIEAENDLKQAQEDLLDLLNYIEVLQPHGSETEKRAHTLYENLDVVPTTELSFEEFPLHLEDAVGDALARRPDLMEARLQVSVAQTELERRRNFWLPSLNLTGSWTQRGLEGSADKSLNEMGSGKFYDWAVGVILQYPLGNRLQRNELAKAKASLASSKLSHRKLENSVVLEVTQAARSIQSSYQRVQTTRAATRLRKEQLEGEKQRLRVGASTSYQVLQTQNDLLEAQTQELRAQVDYTLSITRFQLATGSILEEAGVSIPWQ